MTYKCGYCKSDKTIDEFYPEASDGSWCKKCINKTRNKRTGTQRKAAAKLQQEQENILAVVRQFQQNKESYLYLLESGNRYKIGYTTNLDRRIRAFNTASPTPHKIIAVAPGGKQQEAKIHNLLQKYRMFGEWFIRQPEVFDIFTLLGNTMIFLPGYVSELAPSPSCVMDSQELNENQPPADSE